MTGSDDQEAIPHLAGRVALIDYLKRRPAQGTLFLIELRQHLGLTLARQAMDEVQHPAEIVKALEAVTGGRANLFRFDSTCYGMVTKAELDLGQCVLTCMRTLAQLRALPYIDRSGLQFDVGIGVALRSATTSTRSWVGAAFVALSAAATAPSRYSIYDSEMQQRVRREEEIRHQLSQALTQQELSLLYQPKLSLIHGQCTGVEALLRWHSASLGDVPQSEYLPILEHSPFELEVFTWVIRRSCFELSQWLKSNADRQLSVNVSSRLLVDSEFIEGLVQNVDLFHIPHSQFVIEITERQSWTDRNVARKVLEELRGRGFKIAIDDFGSGFSSLEYLIDFPADHLKIDQRFVSRISSSVKHRFLVELVAQLGHEFGFEVVAEGAETPDQLEALRFTGCDSVQGFAVSYPLECEEFLEWDKTVAFEATNRGRPHA